MRKVGLLVILLTALALLNATPAFADGLDFSSSNQGGSVSYAGTGGAAKGAGIPINSVAFGSNPALAVTGENCGTKKSPVACGMLSFSTGNFITAGVNGAGQAFEEFAGGGSLTIVGTVNGGSPVTLLSAVFSSPVTITQVNKNQLQLSGAITITALDSSVKLIPSLSLPASGSSAVLVLNANFGRNGSFSGKGASPDIFVATPEPSGMMLLGSGLIGLSALLRRKEKETKA